MKLIKISAVWCSSCIIMNNIWEDLKKQYPYFTYEEYDYDFDTEIVDKYEVGKIIPVIIILNEDNVEISRIIGEKSKKEIFETIERL